MKISGTFAVKFSVNSEAIKEFARNGGLSENNAYPSGVKFNGEMIRVEKPSSCFVGKVLGVRIAPAGGWGKFTIRIDAEGEFTGAYFSLFGGDFVVLPDEGDQVESSLFRGDFEEYRKIRDELEWRSEETYALALHRAFGGKVIGIKEGESFPRPWRVIEHGGELFAARGKFA